MVRKKKKRKKGIKKRERKEKIKIKEEKKIKPKVIKLKTCPHCGAKIENPEINYCWKCENILWYPKLSAKKIR